MLKMLQVAGANINISQEMLKMLKMLKFWGEVEGPRPFPQAFPSNFNIFNSSLVLSTYWSKTVTLGKC